MYVHSALIWYTGHGREDTGDWPLKDGFLTFRDIYELYKTNFRHRPLYIVSDCCYSGAWVKECARLLDRDGITCGSVAKQRGIVIKVFAACLPNETAYDKFFIQYKGSTLKKIPGSSSRIISFAEHQRLGKQEGKCHDTLGVDFTHQYTCFANDEGECYTHDPTEVSTWTERVEQLIQQVPSEESYFS